MDIRWIQRFENFEKAFRQLEKFISKQDLNEMERQGLIKSFEYTYELAWNLLKDYLIYQGHTGITGSRDAIRMAFQQGIITNGEHWMRMIDDRILTVHTYDEETAEQVEQRIVSLYYELFLSLYKQLKSRQ
jgi:nucleotidyltransferase substrate binding protein (TIGR01987 family)